MSNKSRLINFPPAPLFRSTDTVAGPSRTSEHPSTPISSTSSSSHHHHQLPQDPRRAASSNIRRLPSPPQPAPSSSSSTNVPTFQPVEERRRLSPVPAARSTDASTSSRETARGRSPLRASASARPVEIEDATMVDVEQPSTGPSVRGGAMFGQTGARVAPRGRRRSAVSLRSPRSRRVLFLSRCRRTQAHLPFFLLLLSSQSLLAMSHLLDSSNQDLVLERVERRIPSRSFRTSTRISRRGCRERRRRRCFRRIPS